VAKMGLLPKGYPKHFWILTRGSPKLCRHALPAQWDSGIARGIPHRATVTERRMTERRMTEGRKTERTMTKRRMTEGRMTESRK
jgi:hypothetical protein